jgi:hypothetical protein
MTRLFKIQFLGPLTLFVATLSAELAARALESAPASATLWYLNLEVFGMFQRSHARLSGHIDIAGFQLYGIALPIFVLACIGLTVRSRLPLALSTQFAAGYATFLLMSWQTTTATPTLQASLRSIAVPQGEGLYLLASILGTTLLSGLITHWLYLRESHAPA